MCEIFDEDWEKFNKGKIPLKREFVCKKCKLKDVVVVWKNKETVCPKCKSKELELGQWHYVDKG